MDILTTKVTGKYMIFSKTSHKIKRFRLMEKLLAFVEC